MIKATIVQASMCSLTNTKIYTYELTYPRVIHAQIMTHRMFSRNASSTRAVPVLTAIKNVTSDPAQYMWTANQAGMQGDIITDTKALTEINALHEFHMSATMNLVSYMGRKKEDGGLGVHKQNVGRYLEPFQNIKVVLTSTEVANWDWLRDDEESQGEIAELAKAMSVARDECEPVMLEAGEWHVPYVHRERTPDGINYVDVDGVLLSVEDALLVSASSCAQVSYRKSDASLEKALAIKERLFNGRKVHASPVEHQATPMAPFSEYDGSNDPYDFESWESGVTHVSRKGVMWSGNFRCFIQNRQLLPNQNKEED